MDGVAKVAVEGIHVAAVPRDLNGVAYCTLDAAGCGLVFLRYGRVEHLCHRVDDVAILNGQQNGGAQVLVALLKTDLLPCLLGVTLDVYWVS